MYVVKKISFPKGDWAEYEKQVNVIYHKEKLEVDETLNINEYGSVDEACHTIRFKQTKI